MHIDHVTHEHVTVFHLSGRLDSSSTSDLEQQVMSALDQGAPNIIMDFSSLEYINSAGLRILIMTYKRLQPTQGKIFICGVKDYITEVFNISGYNKIFPMRQDIAQAMHELEEAR